MRSAPLSEPSEPSGPDALGRAVVPSPLGPLVVSERGGAIVALDWGNVPRSAGSAVLGEARRQLEAYFAGRLAAFDLPLAPAGTAFQRRVWDRMTAIPFGATATYGALARVTGAAPRAVGAACGRNPIPIIIPCHRVVGAGGALTGYSGQGGLDTKRFLLALERGALPLPFANHAAAS
ncbi:MAG: methylated-DNA--[protein]-cysteine S-methyltransferase [Alphaproteobacteria bacterium]|nr:methylated-DNA--[protein]-cysteine S-methyltransferase [Alphaproteobacteria bacterium]